MNELTKIKNVMQKVLPNAPHDVMLVLDGSTGQNAFYFISSYPETLFNPKSFASSFLSKKLKEGREKPILKIIFQSKISYNKYLIRNLADYFDCKQFQYSSYEHLINFCSSNIDICGKKVKL